MSWVHCNACFLEPGRDNKNFYISNCGHILCQLCQHQKKCPSCGNENYKALKIDSTLPTSIRDYFNDVTKMMNTAMKRILDVKNFQDNQVRSLAKALLNHQSATLELQKKNGTLKSALDAAKKENESLTVSVKFYSDALAKKTEECEGYKKKLEDQTRMLTTPVRQQDEKSPTECTPVQMLSESFITPKNIPNNPYRNNNAGESARRSSSIVSKKTPMISQEEESPLIAQLNDTSEEGTKNDFLNTHAMLGLPTKAKRSRFTVDDEEEDFSSFVSRTNRSSSSNSAISIQSEVSSLFRKPSSSIQSTISSSLRDQRDVAQQESLAKNPFQSSSIPFTPTSFAVNIDQLSGIPQKAIVAKFDARVPPKNPHKDAKFSAIMKGTITKGNVIPRLADF